LDDAQPDWGGRSELAIDKKERNVLVKFFL
jgi:hypothetical protein